MIAEIYAFISPYFAWVGLVLGIAGGVILAFPSYRAKVIGFEIWVYSNIAWLFFAYSIKSWPVAINYIFFMLISIGGIWTHLPLADAEKKDRDSLLEIPKKV